MQGSWVKAKLHELENYNRDGEFDLTMLNNLRNALTTGKLRGITLKTPWQNRDAGTFGDTFKLQDHGFYSP